MDLQGFLSTCAFPIIVLLYLWQAVHLHRSRAAYNLSLFTHGGLLCLSAFVGVVAAIHGDQILFGGAFAATLVLAYILWRGIRNKRQLGSDSGIESITLAELIDQMPGHVYWKDSNCISRGCNRNNWRDFGLESYAAYKGVSDYDLFPEEEANQVSLVDQAVMRTGKACVAEEWVTTAQGKRALYLSHKSPLRNKQGKILGVLGISIDVTDSHQATKDRLETLENVLAVTPGNVYWIDRDGVYLGCNDNEARAVGLSSREEIIGKRNVDFEEFVVPEVLDRVNEAVMMTGNTVTVQEPVILKGGEEGTYLSTKVPMRDPDGRVAGLIGTSIDITKLKKTEAQLLETQKKLEDANIVKSEFIANMSHDMRTPITGIIGMAETLGKEPDAKKRKQNAELLTHACHDLLNLLNDFIDVAQVETGGLGVVAKRMDVIDSINSVVRLAAPAAYEKGLKLKTEYDSAIPPVLIGDARRITKILSNLVNNAVKFTEVGEVRVGVHLVKQTYKDAILKFIIEDTGVGIPEDKQEIIFTRFRRLTSSYQGVYKGTGVGLSIVKQFIEDLDGEVQVQSKVGKGSVFTCLIPFKKPLLNEDGEEIPTERLQQQDVETEKLAKAAGSAHPRVPVSRPGDDHIHALLVEDNLLAQTVGRSKLEELDCVVEVVDNGQDAIDKAQTEQYDIIFMDIGLPGDIDGCDATVRIRAWEAMYNYHIPIVAVTAHVDSKHRRRCLDAGMDMVLNKPLTAELAAEALRSLVPNWRKGDEEVVSPLEDLAVVDRDLAIQLSGGDEEMADNMLRMLLSTLPEAKAEIEAAYKKQDYSKLQALVHKLHGGACYSGTPQLQAAAKSLEMWTPKEHGPNELDERYYALIQSISTLLDTDE